MKTDRYGADERRKQFEKQYPTTTTQAFSTKEVQMKRKPTTKATTEISIRKSETPIVPGLVENIQFHTAPRRWVLVNAQEGKAAKQFHGNAAFKGMTNAVTGIMDNVYKLLLPGLHLKVGLDELGAFPIQEIGYVRGGYNGKLRPLIKGLPEITDLPEAANGLVTSEDEALALLQGRATSARWFTLDWKNGQIMAGAELTLEDPEPDESNWNTKMRATVHKHEAIDYLLTKEPISLTYSEHLDRYAELKIKQIFEMTAEEREESWKQGIAKKQSRRTAGRTYAMTDEEVAETVEGVASLPVVGGGEIAVSDLLGATVVVFNGYVKLSNTQTEVDETNLQRLVAFVKGNRAHKVQLVK